MEALQPVKFVIERLKGGAWGDLAEAYAGRIAFVNSVREAEASTPSNVIPFPGIEGVGIPPRPERPRAA